MSWRDRPYRDEDARPEMRLHIPRPSTVVGWIIGINVAIHFVNTMAAHNGPEFLRTFGLSLNGIKQFHIWQLVTYMFLHDPGDVWHIVFNMVMLWFVGSEIERGFGRQRFLEFYFACGLFGGLAYVLYGLANPIYARFPLVGASGAVYGVLVAAMVFYPSMQLVLIMFMVPIRVFGAVMFGILLLQVISPGPMCNPGGEICHIGGALTAVALFYVWGTMPRLRVSTDWQAPGPLGRLFSGKNAWVRKQERLAEEQAEVDRILQKVHREGITSLSRREKKRLAQATRNQQHRDRDLGRIDRV
jgi:membrane associated rhomboid family serine protease